jgi:thioredoxin-related protein
MKKAFLFLGLLLISITVFSQGIVFETGTWNQVLVKAKLTNKPIFVDIYTTWCGPCKKMSTKVFPKEEVGKVYNENFICYSVDAEKGEGLYLAGRYEVHAFPTYLFVRPNGELCAINLGYMDAKKIIDLSKTALKSYEDTKSLKDYESAYAKKKTDPQFMIDYLNKRRAFGESNDVLFDEFLKMLPEQERSSDQVAELYNAEIERMSTNSFACENLIKNKALFEGKNIGNISNRLKSCALQSMRLAQKNRDLKLLDCAILAYGEEPPTPLNYLNDYFYMQYYQALGDKKRFAIYASSYFNNYLVKFTPDKQMNKNMVGKLLIGTSSYVANNISDEKLLQDALSWSKRALEFSPEDPNYLYVCGTLQYKLGQKEEAKQGVAYAISKMKDPNSATAKLYQETLRKMNAGKKIL